MGFFEELAGFLKQGKGPHVLVTVVGTKGSTPRKTSSRMVMAADGKLLGTVGGGPIESWAIERAKQMVDAWRAQPSVQPLTSLEEFSLAQDKASCGGQVQLYFELIPSSRRVFIFGGGHVGQALAPMLRMLELDVTVVDDREQMLEESAFSGCGTVHSPEYTGVVEAVAPGEDDLCLIMTHGHSLDKEVLQQLLGTKAFYIGLMASRRKRGAIFGMMKQAGFTDEDLLRVYSPVGLSIGAETPAEIAVSITAEIVAILHEIKTETVSSLRSSS
jgi:xanthine dehydrogenase accessory factor